MRRTIALIAGSLLALAPAALSTTASAATPGGAFEWHVADQFLHDAVGSPLGAIARADNGDTVTIEGMGAIDVAAKTASGSGTFVHRESSGAIHATGTFQAISLISFQPFGCGGDGVPSFLCGGIARLNIIATPDAAPSVHLPAILWIDCALGNPPPSVVEGVRVDVKDVINFNKSLSEEEGSGFTVFVAQG